MPPRPAALVCALVLAAHAPAARAQLVPLPPAARSIHILRAGETVRTGPSSNAPRRGTLARGAHLPVYEAALGPGCASRWVRIGSEAWVCQAEAALSEALPDAQSLPVVPAGATLPYLYLTSHAAGTPTYRRLEDVTDDDRSGELEHGMGFAVLGTDTAPDGHAYVRTASHGWVVRRALGVILASDRDGVTLNAGEHVAIVTRAVTPSDSAEACAHHRASPVLPLATRTLLRVRDASDACVQTDAGWLPRRSVTEVPESDPPRDLRDSERWVDVDLAHQLMRAYEGTRVVYASLVSTGAGEHATQRGEFRVWVKLAMVDMSNADTEVTDTLTRVYAVERVPWVMFFHADQALHAAYWHDRFGTRRSHGCVNLPPRAARWLFAWAPPVLPPGWEAVLPTADDPGLRVRVH